MARRGEGERAPAKQVVGEGERAASALRPPTCLPPQKWAALVRTLSTQFSSQRESNSSKMSERMPSTFSGGNLAESGVKPTMSAWRTVHCS